MTSWGYTLSSEEFGPVELVECGVAAERVGFDFLTVSDHYHPWTQSQGHSPFAWTTVGSVGARTDRIAIGTGVTCPLIRVHPAIVAQAAASSSALTGGRFFLGVGTGEALNEHITGEAWPAIEVRWEMLAEAVEIMRLLWTGETIDHWGDHYVVENARIFTRPAGPIEVIWAASGPASAALAAEHGDGLWSTSPDDEVVRAYRDAGGDGPVYGQVSLCWSDDADAALDTVHAVWPNAGVPGQLSQDLPTWTHFEQVSELVTKEMLAERIPCGDDVDRVVESVRAFTDAGFDHIHFHQIGPDQAAFLDAWNGVLLPALTS